jgi:hypothetical protein
MILLYIQRPHTTVCNQASNEMSLHVHRRLFSLLLWRLIVEDKRLDEAWCACVCACVFVREREKERKRESV